MSLFDDSDSHLSSEKGGRQIRAISDRSKLPETPDMSEWGAQRRPGNPFALSDFSSGAPANTTKP